MPLAPIRIDNQGNNILRQIIAGQNVSLRDALAKGVQGTRDALNNQANQEAAFLNQRRFDRNFREQQLQDRRDFSRRVVESDRNFGEGVRQFNVSAADRDADRALRGELGRGNLSIARQGLNLRRKESDQRLKIGALGLERERLRLENEKDRDAEIDNFRERERVANDPQAFASLFPELPAEEQEERRQIELSRLGRDGEFLGLRGNARLNTEAARGVQGTLLPEQPRDDTAQFTFDQAQEIAATRPAEALEMFAQAEAEATPGSPIQARIAEARKVFKAEREAALEGTTQSTQNADSAIKIYNERKSRAFGNDSNARREIEAVNASLTRDQYVKSGDILDSEGQSIFSGAELDARNKARAEFYDLVRSSSPKDLNRALSAGDPYGEFVAPR